MKSMTRKDIAKVEKLVKSEAIGFYSAALVIRPTEHTVYSVKQKPSQFSRK